MDLATDLVYLKKLLMTVQKHYQNPHLEAKTLKLLWTYDKPPDREREINVSKEFLKEATEVFEDPNGPREKALGLIRKGLSMNPRCHRLYALRGEIYTERKDWESSIKWYETARRMLKLENTSQGGTSKGDELYNEQLKTAYCERGKFHEKNGRLIEAAADFEQVLVLRPRQNQLFAIQHLNFPVACDVTQYLVRTVLPSDGAADNNGQQNNMAAEDMLLKCLRKLEKYEAYCRAWSEFVENAKPQRTADLMTQHAEFKIHITEVDAARRMLREAVTLDKKNIGAQELLQVIFDTGHTMLVYAIIWCINGCYDKALMTIDKGTDCDPYNPGFTVLKAIVLRLSGRLKEAIKWLETVNRSFFKLLEPTLSNRRKSIVGSMTVAQTKSMLVNQWYLIRYDMALEHMLGGRYQEALVVLRNEGLLKRSLEARVLMGDCLMSQGRVEEALKSYLEAHKAGVSSDFKETSNEKRSLIAQRIAEILNSRSLEAVQNRLADKSLATSEICLKIIAEGKIMYKKLGMQRAEALMYAARSRYQKSTVKPTNSCLKTLGDSLSFGRGSDDGGLRDTIFGNSSNLNNFIHSLKAESKFPYRTKILMQNY